MIYAFWMMNSSGKTRGYVNSYAYAEAKVEWMKHNHPMLGRHHDDATKDRISSSLKGKEGPNKGRSLDEEWKNNISASLKDNKRALGKHWKCSLEHNEKVRKAMTGYRNGMHWWNNGVKNVISFECPGEGWIKGRRLA